MEVAGSKPDEVNELFFNLPNISGSTKLWGLLIPMSSGNRNIIFMESRARPVRRADNITAICESTIYTTV
jgi:hypothetical protein